MPSAFLRLCAFLAGGAVVAAATHANVAHAGGYQSADAPLLITLALLLSIGMGFCGYVWRNGQRFGAVILGLCIISGEAYWVLTNTEREIAAREEPDAPAMRAYEARAEAEQQVEEAVAALKSANDAVTTEASKKDCLKNCAAMLTAAAAAARNELAAARNVLSNTPRPLSPAPLPARLGIAPWLWDLVMAGLRSVAVVGGSLAIGMSGHAARTSQPRAESMSASAPVRPKRKAPKPTPLRAIPPPSSRDHVASFLRSAIRPDPEGQISLRALHRRYSEWCEGEGLSATELGRELRAIIDALGLECEEAGRDVMVYGAAISD